MDVIYTDFEKALDRVVHEILLFKLQALGIHGENVKNYIRNIFDTGRDYLSELYFNSTNMLVEFSIFTDKFEN